jgi:hypothetical protein
LESLQTTGDEPAHWPDWQASVWVQALPSLQAVPFGSDGKVQPLDGLQKFWVQALPSSQVTVLPAAQAPAWQASPCVQALLSVHSVPSAAVTCWHTPVAGSHESSVQALPSAHWFGWYRHWPFAALHESSVQGLPSLQVTGDPPTHDPVWQASPCVHRLLSLHVVPFASGVYWHPDPAAHASCVQGLPSLHTSGPITHCPVAELQDSDVQTLPSSQVIEVPWQYAPAPPSDTH